MEAEATRPVVALTQIPRVMLALTTLTLRPKIQKRKLILSGTLTRLVTVAGAAVKLSILSTTIINFNYYSILNTLKRQECVGRTRDRRTDRAVSGSNSSSTTAIIYIKQECLLLHLSLLFVFAY